MLILAGKVELGPSVISLNFLVRTPLGHETGPVRPLTLSLSPFGGEGIETAPSPSPRERVGVRVAHEFTHDPV